MNHRKRKQNTQDVILTLKCEIYLAGDATVDYDEDDSLTYRTTVHHRLPILGKLVPLLSTQFCSIRTRLFAYRTYNNRKEISAFAEICVCIRIYCFSPSFWILLRTYRLFIKIPIVFLNTYSLWCTKICMAKQMFWIFAVLLRAAGRGRI